jgi:F0F1-type ATP synthase membrane subunit b/b'
MTAKPKRTAKQDEYARLLESDAFKELLDSARNHVKGDLQEQVIQLLAQGAAKEAMIRAERVIGWSQCVEWILNNLRNSA